MKAHRKEDREFAWIFGVLTLFGVWLVSIAWRMLRGVREMDKIALQLGLPSSHYDALYWISWGCGISNFDRYFGKYRSATVSEIEKRNPSLRKSLHMYAPLKFCPAIAR